MKSKWTLKGFFSRKEGWFFALVVLALMFAGCYEFFSIDQPTEAYSNSSFDVNIVVKDDGGGNDWTVEGLQDIGLFGVLLPEGWTVKDSIYFTIVSDSADHNNVGYLRYSSELTTMLEDSIGSPEDYGWWGAKTTQDADMTYFDSLYFTVTINTDDKTGTYSLQYSVGDQDYWDRNPSDALSDPLPIEITEFVDAISGVIDESKFSIYPNPASDKVFVELDVNKYANAQLRIYNMSGKLLKSVSLMEAESVVDLSGFAGGTYVMNISSDQGSVSGKILVK